MSLSSSEARKPAGLTEAGNETGVKGWSMPLVRHARRRMASELEGNQDWPLSRAMSTFDEQVVVRKEAATSKAHAWATIT